MTARSQSGYTTSFSYAYTDSELTEFRELVQVPDIPPGFFVLDHSGNTSAFAPEHLANLWVGKTLGRRFRVAGGVRYIGDQFTAADNNAEIDSHFLASASAAADFGRFRLTLNLENLTDEDYETRGFGSASVIPGNPFAAYFGVEVRSW